MNNIREYNVCSHRGENYQSQSLIGKNFPVKVNCCWTIELPYWYLILLIICGRLISLFS